jgi:hypothetical protein
MQSSDYRTNAMGKNRGKLHVPSTKDIAEDCSKTDASAKNRKPVPGGLWYYPSPSPTTSSQVFEQAPDRLPVELSLSIPAGDHVVAI